MNASAILGMPQGWRRAKLQFRTRFFSTVFIAFNVKGCGLPGPLITHFVVLAVDLADSQQIEDGRPGPAFIFAFFFHANEAAFRLALAIILNHGDGVALQRVGPVAESSCGCD